MLAVFAFPGAVAASHASPPASARPGELLVRFEPGAAQTRALNALDAKVVQRLPLGLVRVKLEPGTTVAAAEAAFERRPEVRYAQPNHRYQLMATPNDPSYPSLWGLNQASDADIDAPEAWDLTTGSAQLTVAVVDTGIDYNHPDLQQNIWTNDDPIDGADNDANGKIDDLRGWDFADNDNNPADVDDHGTHVAGTIGARGNNTTGVTGVNWNVKLMALKACCDLQGALDDAWIVQAFHYACVNGAKVINGSFGGYGYSQAIHDAIEACPNSLFVFSAGNDAVDNDLAPSYPCNDTGKNVMCVAATDSFDNLAYFSNHGGNVELAAPGHQILSTVPANAYNTFSGTSMAAPHVSGAAALVLAHRPTLTPVEVRRALMLSTDRKASLFGYVETGRLNVARALTQDITPPTVPGISSTTPVGVWTNSSTISVSWGGATDQAGIGGYSFSWSPDPEFEPDETKDVEANVTSIASVLPDGQQWFHVRAGDPHGNFSGTKHIGPFLIDTFPPVRPTLSSPTHRAGVPSANRMIEINWASTSDSVSGLDGFSFAWGRQQIVPVDHTKDAEESVFRTTSTRLDPGAWWFGIRAKDNAGNWSDTVVLGPFVITGTAPVCNVPRLRGLTLVGAKRLLVKRGCALGRITRAYSRRVARGRVIAQKRTPGLRLARGAKVGVVLSRGRRR
jgi:subtilisin family serine protease